MATEKTTVQTVSDAVSLVVNVCELVLVIVLLGTAYRLFQLFGPLPPTP